MTEQRVVRSNCGMCHGGCGILVHLDEGNITKVEGDPECPVNEGAMCPQGLAVTQFVYHPGRLKYPLRRVGKRGEGKWERISWDKALDMIAARVGEIRSKDGPLSVAGGCGTGRPVHPSVRRFLSVLGSPNRIGYPHNCSSPMEAVGAITYGNLLRPDFENSRCIVAWGCNLTRSRTARGGRLLIEAWKKGAKLISIDPDFSPIAARSEVWLQLRPGTDGALALAWLNVIISESLYARDFVEKWTFGFDKLADHVKPFTPEWAEAITWVPAAKIRQAARIYATLHPASLYAGVAPEFGINVTNTMRCIHLLPALTGNVDIPGGNTFLEIPVNPSEFSPANLLPREVWEKAAGGYPLLLEKGARPIAGHAGWRAILTEKPYPIKALLVHGLNPLVDHENVKMVYEALMKVEFLSVMDHFMTPTAELADIVLPACTFLEKDNIHFVFSMGLPPAAVCAAPKVIEPLGESKDDAEVFIELSKRLELDYGASSVVGLLDTVLKPKGLNFAQLVDKRWLLSAPIAEKYQKGLLRPDKTAGFDTPSGMIELYSNILEGLGLSPLPIYKEPTESPVSTPELASTYPLVLSTSGRSPAFFHSQYRQVPWLRELHRDPLVRLNPETAKRFGIKDGDWIYIESPRGRCKQKAALTVGVDPRVVLAEHGWWFPEKAEPDHGVWDSNLNILTESEPPHDPGLGSTPARGLLCKIYRAEES